ncbi:MAG TPA: hypothetical protein VK588_13565, partial [Chitinophagaceae bacterium]|nr:hypothetical protein [Chitinophagaceae bacterium]
DKVGRKWIMMAGMFLAIVTYRPLFGKIFSIADEKTKTEITSNEQISTTLKAIAKTDNSLRTQSIIHSFDNGMLVTETKIDTLYSEAGKSTLKPDIKLSKLLSGKDYWEIVGIVFIMIMYVTMVYGPIAAFLVEMFPTKIRYTSMSLPYHIGNGIFGGLTPFIALLLTTIYTGDKLVGLFYPIMVAGVCLLIGLLYLKNKIDPDVND